MTTVALDLDLAMGAPGSDIDDGFALALAVADPAIDLRLVTTVHGLPVAFALSNAKTNEREVLVDLVSLQPHMFHHPDGLILVVDKG